VLPARVRARRLNDDDRDQAISVHDQLFWSYCFSSAREHIDPQGKATVDYANLTDNGKFVQEQPVIHTRHSLPFTLDNLALGIIAIMLS